MIIVTCANTNVGKDHSGRFREDAKFRFAKVISKTARNAERFGYGVEVYDLGKLGMGIPYRVDDEHFVRMGHYEREAVKGYKSKSLFKPSLMRECLTKNKQLTAYLDGDAELRRRIDDVMTDDYDLGVTLRDRSELETSWYKEHASIVKFLNAGVIFFNYTPATLDFIDRWDKLTDDVGNDQMALNSLACPETYPDPGSIHVIDGVRIKYFPCVKYNYYYFFDIMPWHARIMHFKGDVRHLYPFNWPKYAASLVWIPIKNAGRALRRLRRGRFTAKRIS